jgi:hypothetical protein
MTTERKQRNIAMHLDQIAQYRLRAQMAEAYGFEEIIRRCRVSIEREEKAIEALKNKPTI